MHIVSKISINVNNYWWYCRISKKVNWYSPLTICISNTLVVQHILTQAHTHTHTTYSYIHTHTLTHTDAYTHSYVYTQSYTHAHAHAHTHTYARTHIHTHYELSNNKADVNFNDKIIAQ